MSLFFVSTPHSFAGSATTGHHHRHRAHGGRCGNELTDGIHLAFGGRSNPLFDEGFAAYDVFANERAVATAALLRRRQAEAEREEELRRRRIQHEQRRREAQAAALAAAWQAEQEREQRLLAERRRREWEAVQRRRYLAKVQEEHRRRQAAQEQWEKFAIQGIAGALEFASQFFDAFNVDGDDKPVAEQSTKTEEPATAADTKPVQNDTDMQVDGGEAQDPPEVVPQPVEQDVVTASEEAPQQAPTAPAQKLVFSLPLPKDESQRSSIKADNIKVDFDENTRSVVIRGLWNKDEEEQTNDALSSNGSISSDDEDSSRGRKRSRSPKRSRVSDVDETTGEEIVVATAADEEKEAIPSTVALGKQAQGSARVSVPEGSDLSNLRAELTDEGFRLFL